MQVVLLLGLGLLPFGIGWLMEWFMYNTELPTFLITWPVGLLFIALWCLIVWVVKPYVKSAKQVVLWLNLIPLIVLILLGVQDLILNRYWPNAVGIWTQKYYLPALSIGYELTPWAHRVFWAQGVAFVLMVAASILGCVLRDKKK